MTTTPNFRKALGFSQALAGPGDRPPDRLRQGYGGPPKLYAKAEGGHYGIVKSA